MSTFGLPAPQRTLAPTSKENAILMAELSYNVEEQTRTARSMIANFNQEQRSFFDAVMVSLSNGNDGKLFCVDAPGGTGKTYLLNGILAAVRADGHIAIATALSAVASKLLTGGTTLHSKLKVPIDVKKESLCNFTSSCGTGKMLQKAKLLIIDEVSMGHRHIYEAIDRSLRTVRGNNKVMGGLTVILAGDWRQCLPIIEGGGEAQVVGACLKNSALWSSVKVFHLTDNMRVRMSGSAEVEEHSKWLLKVGQGECGDGELTIPERMRLPQETLASLVEAVYPNLTQRYTDTTWLGERAILSPTNKEVAEVNDLALSSIPGNEVCLRSIDSTEDGSTEYPPEFLNTLELSGLPPHLLKLKQGAKVILLRTMDAKNGHCNDVVYTVCNIRPHVLELRAITGSNIGAILLLPRIVSISKSASLPFKLRRKQFPIAVAFGYSANKVYISIERLLLHLKFPLF